MGPYVFYSLTLLSFVMGLGLGRTPYAPHKVGFGFGGAGIREREQGEKSYLLYSYFVLDLHENGNCL
jgi:hypothetical protein